MHKAPASMRHGKHRLPRPPPGACPALQIWCERGDLNSHGLPHWNLNPARLPIPPLSLGNRPIAIPVNPALYTISKKDTPVQQIIVLHLPLDTIYPEDYHQTNALLPINPQYLPGRSRFTGSFVLVNASVCSHDARLLSPLYGICDASHTAWHPATGPRLVCAAPVPPATPHYLLRHPSRPEQLVPPVPVPVPLSFYTNAFPGQLPDTDTPAGTGAASTQHRNPCQ